jgi:hypothetical protein
MCQQQFYVEMLLSIWSEFESELKISIGSVICHDTRIRASRHIPVLLISSEFKRRIFSNSRSLVQGLNFHIHKKVNK